MSDLPKIIIPQVKPDGPQELELKPYQRTQEDGDFQQKADETKGWIHDPWWRFRFWSIQSARDLNHPVWWPVAILFYISGALFYAAPFIALFMLYKYRLIP